MPVRITIKKGRVPARVYTDAIEPEALQQMINVSMLPIVSGMSRQCPKCMPASAPQPAA